LNRGKVEEGGDQEEKEKRSSRKVKQKNRGDDGPLTLYTRVRMVLGSILGRDAGYQTEYFVDYLDRCIEIQGH
jgi:hypothetical protein